MMFEPTANIAGFLSGYTGEGSKTIVPSKAIVASPGARSTWAAMLSI